MRAAAERQFEAAHRGEDQTPSGGKLDRAGFGMRLRFDDRLAAHVPLHQQHLMRDLAARYAIDREVTVERAGAHLAERVAHPALVERIARAYRGASDKPGGVSLRRGIVALAIAGGAHPARELGRRRSEFRRNLRVLFP